ncbi:LpqN/LpqT family lipoprotein [Mycobacterium sp. ST-F2]|uniref:LpqN/LpqT family lipoprotein n=1 Tax=Mycobacterium sp. ST-F2 TaxID=1490484 RepID=UPI00336BFE1D
MATLAIILSGCSASPKTAPATSNSASPSGSANVTTSSRPNIAGPNKTINDYITENNIAETPIKPNDPGTPDFDFPFPPGWSSAGDKTPPWAYGAIVYDKPADPSDPPTMIAIASKLTGNVDPAMILKYAPSQLLNLPDFKPLGEPEKSSLSGFEAIQSAGTYTHEGKARVVAQKTVIIPGKDALFVLQLNADALQGQEQVVIDAADVIEAQTKITA